MAKAARKPEPAASRFNIYLPRALHLALMRRAFEESAAKGRRVTASQIVKGLIERYLGRKGG